MSLMTEHITTYPEWRASIAERFAAMSPVPGSTERHSSSSGNYVLEVCAHSSGEATWSYSRGTVRRCQDQSVVADVVRNFGSFWFAWVEQKGEEFLLCGEDYQGYNVINLNTGENVLTFPPEAFDGVGYCWVAAHPSPDGCVIAVEGCYWACPYSLVFYDFTDPLRSPLPELARYEDLDQVQGWTSSDEFAFTVGEDADRKVEVWRYGEQVVK